MDLIFVALVAFGFMGCGLAIVNAENRIAALEAQLSALRAAAPMEPEPAKPRPYLKPLDRTLKTFKRPSA